jgi:hypothetical protein
MRVRFSVKAWGGDPEIIRADHLTAAFEMCAEVAEEARGFDGEREYRDIFKNAEHQLQGMFGLRRFLNTVHEFAVDDDGDAGGSATQKNARPRRCLGLA